MNPLRLESQHLHDFEPSTSCNPTTPHPPLRRAMVMGAMTVIVQTLGPEEAFDAIEYGTLALLWGMMVLVEYLKDDALFDM